MTDESLRAATFAALDAAVVERDRLRGERDRARALAAADSTNATRARVSCDILRQILKDNDHDNHPADTAARRDVGRTRS